MVNTSSTYSVKKTSRNNTKVAFSENGAFLPKSESTKVREGTVVRFTIVIATPFLIIYVFRK